MAAVQRVVGAALLFTKDGNETYNGKMKNESTEAEVEEWVRRWKRGLETRALITDEYAIRGWEAKELLVVIEGQLQLENLVMRTCVAFAF